MNIRDLVAKDFTLTGHGRWLRTAEHDSLVVDTENNIFYWNSKGLLGCNAYIWLTVVKGYPHLEAKKVISEAQIEPLAILQHTSTHSVPRSVARSPELVEIFYHNGLRHREYWHDVRGYTDETIERFRLGYYQEDVRPWYTIPIYVRGSLDNFQLRSPDRRMRHYYKDIGPHPFNFSSLQLTDWVVLTEGPVDAIMLRQHQIPAVSQTSGAGDISIYKENFKEFDHIKRIYIVYDNDPAGYLGAWRTNNLFGPRSTIYNMWDFKEKADVTDYFKAGGTKEDFLNTVSNKGVQGYEIPKERYGQYAITVQRQTRRGLGKPRISKGRPRSYQPTLFRC